MKIRDILTALTLTIGLTMGVTSYATAASESPQEVVDDATKTVGHFASDPNLTWFRDNVGSAKALLVVPTHLKAGFIVGISGGSGVMLAREENVWNYPAFYDMGAVSGGLQAGAQSAELILLAMTQMGVDALLSSKAQLGADASVAAGPIGAGAQAATTDILAFSRAKGIFGGLSVEGAVIKVKDKYNTSYYGPDVRPIDILVRMKHQNAGAEELRKAIAGIGK